MSREALDRDEQLRDLVQAGMTERTSGAHDAAVLSAARAFAESPQAERAPLRRRRRGLAWSAAASVAAAAIAFALVWQIVQHRRELAVVNAEKVQLARLVGRLEEQIVALEGRSTSLAEALRRAEQSGATVPGASASGFARVLATIALTPGAVRGEEETTVVRAPPGVGTIRLELDLGPVAAHDAYRVVLATTGGKETWTSGRLAPQRGRADRVLTVDAPASALESGVYELALRADGSSEDLTYYYFEVARR